MQSGSAVGPWAWNSQHYEEAKKVALSLGCSASAGNQVLLQCLQAADANKLAALIQDSFVSY